MDVKRAVLSLILLATPVSVCAGSGRLSGGLTLLEPASARSAGMAEALTGARGTDAWSVNPAAAAWHAGFDATLSHRDEFADQTYSRLQLASGLKRSALVFSVAQLRSGDLELDDGVVTRTVVAKRDLAVSAGAAHRFGFVGLGLAAKALSSELAETARATAWAADAGLSLYVNKTVMLGAAVQNIGSGIRYIEREDPLPRAARAGLSLTFSGRRSTLLACVDGAYLMNEKIFQPAAALEFSFGPLSLRGGGRWSDLSDEWHAGAGFRFKAIRLDYAHSVVNNLESIHRVSVGYAAGGVK